MEEGIMDKPLSILNKIWERFLIYGCAIPIGWALQLHTYRKKI
jgi:hypothetical protein